MSTPEEQAAGHYAYDRYGMQPDPGARLTAASEGFLAGVKWARENVAECQRCAEQYEYEVRNR